MKVITSPASASRLVRQSGKQLFLVPTMGALHEGHLALIRKARALARKQGGLVAVSIFVNPTQFGPNEDFSRYPRPHRADAALCREAGVDLLFLPSPASMYGEESAGHSCWVDEDRLSRTLCGASRPGHFRGVCTVVAKLFNILQPAVALFGKKDAQQLAIIRRMVRNLNFPVRIVGVETVREADGLALSSRNRYLSAEERAQAPILRKALLAAAAGDRRTPAALRQAVTRAIRKAPLARIDYVEVVDAETLAPPALSGRNRQIAATRRPLLIAVAVFFGKTRLIDNLEVS